MSDSRACPNGPLSSAPQNLSLQGEDTRRTLAGIFAFNFVSVAIRYVGAVWRAALRRDCPQNSLAAGESLPGVFWD